MNTEVEIWKDIPGYEGLYQCSNLGRVKSLGNNYSRKEKILKPQKKNEPYSYYKVILWNSGKIKAYPIHKIVAITFLNHIPNGMKETVDHINGDILDNRSSNLQLLTAYKNNLKSILLNKNNTSSKYVGVTYCKRDRMWHSRINVNSIQKHIGSFLTETEAHNARNTYILDNNLFLTETGYKKYI